MESLNKLLNYLQDIADLKYIEGLMYWEMDTQAPKKSLDYLIDVRTKVSLKAFEYTTNDTYITLINNVLEDKDYKSLKLEDKRYLELLKKEYEKNKRIPSDFYEEYCKVIGNSKKAWTEAKEKNDYSIFEPHLEKVIDMVKKLYNYMYPNSVNLYDSMLNDYEENMTSEKIDILFNELKEEIIPIVKNLKPIEEIKFKKYPDQKLLDVAYYLLDYIGFDNERGKLGIFPHGYTTKLNNDDVRITFTSNKSIFDHVCTVIHEGGHGIYEQNINNELKKYPFYSIDRYAIHESQSRFYENILGRNINFWKPIYKDITEMLNLNISIEDFTKQLNNAHTSLIRTEADELTYCLHIIMRYEIERDLFANKISVKELPRVWKEKSKEYLGLEIKNDYEGVLQDVHWSEGSFGYFPSYLLGSILDGMLLETIEEKLGSIDTILEENRIKEITEYLNKQIHAYGATYTYEEVIERFSGKNVSVKPIVKYFKKKYDIM